MPANTSRLALPYPLPDDTVDVPRDVKALAEKIDPSTPTFQQGTAAARPAAGTAGRFYYAIDTGALSYDTGTGWTTVAPGSLLAVQTKLGAQTGLTASISATLNPMWDRPSSGRMELLYTPPVPVYWELNGWVSVQKQSTAYNDASVGIGLNPVDADGRGAVACGTVQSSDANSVVPFRLLTTFKLNAGVAYAAALYIGPGAGAWAYNCDPSLLGLQGKAFSR